jgi:CheY-like chemotaxis protein
VRGNQSEVSACRAALEGFVRAEWLMLETLQIMLKCQVCANQRSFQLNMDQVRQLRDGTSLRFHCSFCAAPRFWSPSSEAQLAAPPQTNVKSILLVDDDDLIQALLKRVMDSWEASIEVAPNGKDALARLASKDFDLMICDIQMPEMDGEELFRHIQENALIPARRIIFLTGDKRPQTKEFLDRSGCFYLFKPFQFLEFSEHVQAVLAGGAEGK